MNLTNVDARYLVREGYKAMPWIKSKEIISETNHKEIILEDIKVLESKIENNSRLILPKKNFDLDKEITIQGYNNVELVGPAKVKLNKSNCLIRIVNCSNLTIKNIDLVGPSPYLIESDGIKIEDSDDIIVHQCRIKDFSRTGVEYRMSSGIVSECLISDAYLKDTSQLYNLGECDFLTVKNMGYGIYVEDSNIIAIQNWFERCSHAIASGCTQRMASYAFFNNVVNGCVTLNPLTEKIVEKKSAGIDTHETHYGTFVIKGNIVYNAGVGAHLRGGSGIIDENLFQNCNTGIRIGKCLGKNYDHTYHTQNVQIMPNNIFKTIDGENVIWPTAKL